MTPRSRSAWTALVARCLALMIGLLALGFAVPAHALPPGGAATPDDVFTATIERIARDPGPVGRPARYSYTVQVQDVYGDSDISSVRVLVQTSSSFGECATRPDTRGSVLYLWTLTRQGTRLLADGCRSVLRATDARVATTIDTLGQPRSPIEQTPAQPAMEFPDVSYTCPDTAEAISDVDTAEETCDEIAVPQSFDRAAAPGLALVLVGILGWFVVLRVGRTRRS